MGGGPRSNVDSTVEGEIAVIMVRTGMSSLGVGLVVWLGAGSPLVLGVVSTLVLCVGSSLMSLVAGYSLVALVTGSSLVALGFDMAAKRSSSVCMRSTTSFGREDVVSPTFASQPNIAA